MYMKTYTMELSKYLPLAAFSFLYMGTLFVNKYVLSVLKFTYPTIFQGWQTFFAAAFIYTLIRCGKIEEIHYSFFSREQLFYLVPGAALYTISIYAGSVALSKLPITVFVCLQCTTLPSLSLWSYFIYGKVISPITKFKAFLLLLILLSSSWISLPWVTSVLNISSSSQAHHKQPYGYMWMFLYVLFSVNCNLYWLCKENVNQVRKIYKIYFSYIFSVIILVPTSVFLGDVLAAQQFPFLYFTRFYIGCLASGLFGVLLILCAIHLETLGERCLSLQPEFATTIAKVGAVFLSLPLFYGAEEEFSVTMDEILCAFVNLGACLAWECSSFMEPSAPEPLQNEVL